MLEKNKIVSLTIIGLITGAIIGAVVGSTQIHLVTAGLFGSVIGFLAGWIWQSRSGGSDE